MIPDFVEFPKIARLSREIIVTEKIDGTNAVIYVDPEGELLAGSRSQWLINTDNFGFAKWVYEHADENLAPAAIMANGGVLAYSAATGYPRARRGFPCSTPRGGPTMLPGPPAVM